VVISRFYSARKTPTRGNTAAAANWRFDGLKVTIVRETTGLLKTPFSTTPQHSLIELLGFSEGIV
jgi:hypothetical protein